MEFLANSVLNVNVVDLRSASLVGKIDPENRGWYVNTILFDSCFKMFMDILFENEGEFPKGVRKLFALRVIGVHNSLEWKEVQDIYDVCSTYRNGGSKLRISIDCYLIPDIPYRGYQGKKVSR